MWFQCVINIRIIAMFYILFELVFEIWCVL